MAAKNPAVEIPVRIQKDQAQKDVKGLSSDMVKNFAKVGAGLLVLKKSFDLVNGAISAGLRLTKESIKLAMTQQENERKLIQAANMRGKFTRQQFEELQKLNSETQQATGIGDEYQLKLQAQLALMGVSNKELVRATRATIGLSEATGSDLNSSMRIVARTLAGNTQSLRRYGIQAKNSNEAMQMLLQNFEIAKDKGKTLSGQIKILQANFGDLQETFGMSVAKSDRAVSAFEAINRAVLKFNNFFQSDAGSRAVDRWFKVLLGFTEKTIRAFTSLIEVQERLVGEATPSIRRERVYTRALEQARMSPEELGTPTYQDQVNWARRVAKEIVPQTAIELLNEFADELAAVSTAPYVAGGRPGKTGTGSGKPGGAGGDDKLGEKISFMGRDIFGFEAEEQAMQEAQARRLELGLLGLAKDESLRQQKFALREQDLLREAAFNDAQLAQTQAFYDNLAVIGLNGLGNMIANMVQAGLSGEQSLSEVMGRMFGAMLSQVGTMLISLGTATAMAAMASTPVPLLWGLTGGPAGVAAGLGLIAAGGVLTGVGQYVSSAGGATASEMTRTAGTARRMAPTSAADGGRRQQATEETSTVYNINFNGALPGSERRIAKEMKRILSGDYSPAGAY